MNNKEIRTFSGGIEVREHESNEQGESRTVTGYALKFNKRSQDFPGGWHEIIRPGALDKVMANEDDVRALFNHDPNYILARTGNGTLGLTVDNVGLRYEFEAPNTTAGNDLLVSIRRGDISQSSFGFTVGKDGQEIRNENGKTVRYINEINSLFDVSPVTYPAYQTTEVTVRSITEAKEQNVIKEENRENEAEQRNRDLFLSKHSI